MKRVGNSDTRSRRHLSAVSVLLVLLALPFVTALIQIGLGFAVEYAHETGLDEALVERGVIVWVEDTVTRFPVASALVLLGLAGMLWVGWRLARFALVRGRGMR